MKTPNTTTTPATAIWDAMIHPQWSLKGLHHNSKAYAQKMAAMLRETCQNEAEAAQWYRIIRCREIPAKPADIQEPAIA